MSDGGQDPLHVQAADAWIQLGATSATNSVVKLALEAFFHPLGLRCEYMVCDPVSNTEFLMLPTFVGVRWQIDDIAASHRPLFPSAEIMRCYKAEALVSGEFRFTRTDGVGADLLREMEAFDDGRPLNQLIAKSRVATSRFVLRAFERACLPDADADQSRRLIDDPEGFVRSFWAVLAAGPQATPTVG